MAVVKKLKFYLGDNSQETIIKISLSSNGIFSADIPYEITSKVRFDNDRFKTLDEIEKFVNSTVSEYRKLQTKVKRVIIIDFKKTSAPSLNEGIGLVLSYAVSDKEEIGNSVVYRSVQKDPFKNGEYRVLTNVLSSGFDRRGVIPGESLEIDFTEERIKLIEEIHQKLQILSDKLREICTSKDIFLNLLGQSLMLLETTNPQEDNRN